MLRAALTTLIEAVASVTLGLGVIIGVGFLIAGAFLDWLWGFFLNPFVWAPMAAWVVVLTIVAARRGRRAGTTQLSLSALAAGVAGCLALTIQNLVFAAQHPESDTSIGMSWLIVMIAAGFFLAFYLATFPVGALARAVLGPVPGSESVPVGAEVRPTT